MATRIHSAASPMVGPRSVDTSVASDSDSDTSSGSRVSASARTSAAARAALGGALPPAGPVPVRRYFVCNIKLPDGTEKAVYINPIDADGKDVDMPEGWHFDRAQLDACQKIFQNMLDEANGVSATSPIMSTLKSVTNHGFTSQTNTSANHTVETKKLFQDFQDTLLTGTIQPRRNVTATLSAQSDYPTEARNRRGKARARGAARRLRFNSRASSPGVDSRRGPTLTPGSDADRSSVWDSAVQGTVDGQSRTTTSSRTLDTFASGTQASPRRRGGRTSLGEVARSHSGSSDESSVSSLGTRMTGRSASGSSPSESGSDTSETSDSETE